MVPGRFRGTPASIPLNTTVITVGIIFLLGYIAMFISVISQNSAAPQLGAIDADSNLRGQADHGGGNSGGGGGGSAQQLQQALRLIAESNAEISKLRTQIKGLDHSKAIPPNSHLPAAEAAVTKAAAVTTTTTVRPGVIVLGMHRSGTSVLGGLMNKMGLKTGEPLIGPSFDNEKGFFERVDVVLQNDALMRKQGIDYSSGTHRYDHVKGLQDTLTNTDVEDIHGHSNLNGIERYQGPKKFFNEGRRGLHFLNNPENYPWMLKDPRLCITVRTWIPLLNFVPAIVFTFRHPLDVAMSMHKREGFAVLRGLRMWYVYNRRAVEQSNDLCRVTTSHSKVMSQPQIELDRIYHELREICGVPVPKANSESEIKTFVDVKLQHGRTSLIDDACHKDLQTITPPADVWQPNTDMEINVYRACMQAYCAMEDGSAYKGSVAGYKWDASIQD